MMTADKILDLIETKTENGEEIVTTVEAEFIAGIGDVQRFLNQHILVFTGNELEKKIGVELVAAEECISRELSEEQKNYNVLYKCLETSSSAKFKFLMDFSYIKQVQTLRTKIKKRQNENLKLEQDENNCLKQKGEKTENNFELEFLFFSVVKIITRFKNINLFDFAYKLFIRDCNKIMVLNFLWALYGLKKDDFSICVLGKIKELLVDDKDVAHYFFDKNPFEMTKNIKDKLYNHVITQSEYRSNSYDTNLSKLEKTFNRIFHNIEDKDEKFRSSNIEKEVFKEKKIKLSENKRCLYMCIRAMDIFQIKKNPSAHFFKLPNSYENFLDKIKKFDFYQGNFALVIKMLDKHYRAHKRENYSLFINEQSKNRLSSLLSFIEQFEKIEKIEEAFKQVLEVKDGINSNSQSETKQVVVLT